MKQAISAVWMAVLLVWGQTALAQTQVWLQVEAQPNLRAAEVRARAYAAEFGAVAGYQLSSGWYAILIGPVAAADAAGRLAELRSLGRVPADSFIAEGGNFRQQFWPIGANGTGTTGALGVVQPDPGAEAESASPAEPLPDEQQVVLLEPVLAPEPEETPAQARRSEAGLSDEDRALLQTAMQWQGFYFGAIDGDFGPGTRNAMAAWQVAQGVEQTGILTATQRDALIKGYRSELAELGLQTVRDRAAGIEIQLPTALVTFDHYDPPFVHYKARGGSGVSVLLISQAGDQNTLFGLYDIMQTLEIVPPLGERSRDNASFTLTGQSATLHSYTYAALQGGLVKGYTLVWQPQDEVRMARVLAAMQASFTPYGDRAMDDTAAAPSEDQRRDMLAGLVVRRPDFSRSGFFIDDRGTVMTTAQAVESCGRITLDSTVDADVTLKDAALGFAILTPRQVLSPPGYAEFQTATPRLMSEVAVAGYPYEDQLPLPTLTFGALEDLRGLNGETGIRRLALSVLPGDAGGPVFDSTGAVLGMLLPRTLDAARVLPDGVSFAANAQTLTSALALSGVTLRASTRQGGMPPEDLTRLASSMTVLVSCWN